jgi:hypothetical protein
MNHEGHKEHKDQFNQEKYVFVSFESFVIQCLVSFAPLREICLNLFAQARRHLAVSLVRFQVEAAVTLDFLEAAILGMAAITG